MTADNSVARGGGGGGGGIMLFRSFVGTFGNLSAHVSRQACHEFCTDKVSEVPTNIERNSTFSMQKCQHFLRSLALLARINIDFHNVSVLSV